MALSALVALLQYPCITLVRGVLKGDPFYVSARRSPWVSYSPWGAALWGYGGGAPWGMGGCPMGAWGCCPVRV